MTAPSRSHSLVVLLLVLTALGGWLRLRHIGFGLPEAAEPDCRIPYQVENLRAGGDWPREDRELTWYPLVIARAAALLPAPASAPQGASVEQHVEAAAAPYVQVRIAGALLALLVVPLTWLLARRFVSPGWALVAAAFAATSLLHVGFSQQSRPHAASAATYLLAMLACIHVRRRGTLLAWGLCGLALALALGTLHSGIAMFLPLAAAWILRARTGGRWLEPRLLIPVVLVAASLPATYPFWFSPHPASMEVEQGSVFRLAAHPVFLREFNGAGFRILLRTFWYYEPVLLVLGVAGLACSALTRRTRAPGAEPQRRADLLVVLAFVVPYCLVIGVYLHIYERFALPLIPYAALLAAWTLERVCASLAPRLPPRAARSVPVALALVALSLPGYAAWRLVEIRGEPTTNQLAARWLQQQLEPGAQHILLTQPLDLPLAREPRGLLVNDMPPPVRSKYYWARYQHELDPAHRPSPTWDLSWLPLGQGAVQRLEADPLGLLAEAGAELAVVEVFAPGRNLPAAAALIAALRSGATRLARITPDARDDLSEHPFGYEDMTHVPAENFLVRLLQAQRTGPVIEIYDLRAPARGH